MRKSEFSQVSIAFTPAQRAWLDAQKKRGWNRSALVRQALDAFIAKSFAATIEEDADFDAADEDIKDSETELSIIQNLILSSYPIN